LRPVKLGVNIPFFGKNNPPSTRVRVRTTRN
jgi:hypothetical protein